MEQTDVLTAIKSDLRYKLLISLGYRFEIEEANRIWLEHSAIGFWATPFVTPIEAMDAAWLDAGEETDYYVQAWNTALASGRTKESSDIYERVNREFHAIWSNLTFDVQLAAIEAAPLKITPFDVCDDNASIRP